MAYFVTCLNKSFWVCLCNRTLCLWYPYFIKLDMRRFLISLAIIIFLPLSALASQTQINVAMTINNDNTIPSLLTMNSVFKNNTSSSNLNFYVIYDNLSAFNRWRIKKFINKSGGEISFIKYELPSLVDGDDRYIRPRKGMFFDAMTKMFLPEFLPENVNKVLYINSDTFVLTDLKALFSTNISKYALGMSIDESTSWEKYLYPEITKYLNNDIMLVNLEYWRKNHTSEKVYHFFRYYFSRQIDRDAFNMMLKKEILTLDQKYNKEYYLPEFKDIPVDYKKIAIVRFVGTLRPWYIVERLSLKKSVSGNSYLKLYYDYWKNSDLKFLIYESAFKNIYIYKWNSLKGFCYYLFYKYKNCFQININIPGNPENPKISVIVPVYNGAKYFPKQAQMLFDQTFKDFEIVYVNDGSTDNTLNILKDLQKKHKNVRVISQKNQGAGVARQVGLDNAKGKYVVFFDVDDGYNKDILKDLYKRAIETDSDVVIGNGQFYNGETYFSEHIRLQLLPNKDVFNYKDVKHFFFNFAVCTAWGKLFRKDFLTENNIRFPDLYIGEDQYFSQVAMVSAERLSIVDKPLYIHYVFHKDSLTHNLDKHPFDSTEGVLLLKDFLKSKNMYKELERDVRSHLISTAIWNYERLSKKYQEEYIKKYKKQFKDLDMFENNPEIIYVLNDFVTFRKFMGLYPKNPVKN